MERWKKIANDLGNRTPVQVQSRVQKYFLKLQKAGLPIPGRAPPSRNKNRYLRPPLKKKFSKQPLLESTKKCSLLSSFVPTVRMDEGESEFMSDDVQPPPDDEIKEIEDDEEELVEHYQTDLLSSEDFKLFQLLNKVKAESEHELRTESTEHVGYKCDHCSSEPILGTRWQCNVCQVDFCNTCLLESGHDFDHELSINR